jgi:hypothetical protein
MIIGRRIGNDFENINAGSRQTLVCNDHSFGEVNELTADTRAAPALRGLQDDFPCYVCASFEDTAKHKSLRGWYHRSVYPNDLTA